MCSWPPFEAVFAAELVAFAALAVLLFALRFALFVPVPLQDAATIASMAVVASIIVVIQTFIFISY